MNLDFLGKAFQQVADLYRSMTPTARVSSGLLATAIVISLVFLFRQQSETANEYLFGARVLTNTELAQMAAALSKASLNDWDDAGNKLRVPRGERHKYLAAIAEGGALPEHAGSAWEQMFANASPWQSRDVQDLRTLRALERELEYTIRELHGIDTAKVNISEQTSDGFPRRKERHAVVTVAPQNNSGLEDAQVRTIRLLIANGGGVASKDVVVADATTGMSFPGIDENSPLTDDAAYYAIKQREENSFRRQIEKILSHIPNVKVEVAMVLDREKFTRTQSVKPEPKGTTTKATEYQEETTSSTAPDGGRVGAEPNAVGNQGRTLATAGQSTQSTSNKSGGEQLFVAGHTISTTETVGFVPTDVKTTIFVPHSHLRRLWNERYPPAAGQPPKEPDPNGLQTLETDMKAEIEKSVNNLLPPVPPGVDPYPRVVVTTYHETPVAIPAGPTLADTTSAWLAANWQSLGLFVLALAGVFLLRGSLRRGPAPPSAAADAAAHELASGAAEGGADEAAAAAEEVANSLRSRMQTSGRSLKEELSELVREDVDAAANVLRNWIRNAA